MIPHRKPLRQVLDYWPTPVSQSTIRRAYLKWRGQQGLPVHCDNSTCLLHGAINASWNAKPISMILDHIDGNRKNNRPSNLRLLCPNCDSQLPTRGGGNKGRIRNATADSYHVIERTGEHEVKVMLTGVSATMSVGNVVVKDADP